MDALVNRYKDPLKGADFSLAGLIFSRADFRSGRAYIIPPVTKNRYRTNARLSINAPYGRGTGDL